MARSNGHLAMALVDIKVFVQVFSFRWGCSKYLKGTRSYPKSTPIYFERKAVDDAGKGNQSIRQVALNPADYMVCLVFQKTYSVVMKPFLEKVRMIDKWTINQI